MGVSQCVEIKKQSDVNGVFLSFQLVHGPSTKTRVAYILSLLRQPTEKGNESTLLEEEEEEENSDVEDGDITMLNTEVTSLKLTWHKVTVNSFSSSFIDCWSLLRLCCRPSKS